MAQPFGKVYETIASLILQGCFESGDRHRTLTALTGEGGYWDLNCRDWLTSVSPLSGMGPNNTLRAGWDRPRLCGWIILINIWLNRKGSIENCGEIWRLSRAAPFEVFSVRRPPF